ncbi:MAG: NAD(P)/FAD-dependent oxidoreductase [Chloroflexota bacterium]
MKYDVVVIGAGQSGLATGYYLQQAGLRFVILEKGEAPAGSWPQYYESLRLFSPAAYSSLPAYPFPYPPTHYPTKNEVSHYLQRYAETFQLPILTGVEVKEVAKADDGFIVRTNDKAFSARAVVASSGAFNRPYQPQLPNEQSFSGNLLHSSSYKSPKAYKGQRVVIVGGGNSAIQIAAELSEVAQVTVATRRPLRFFPQTVLGYDVHVWLRRTGADYLPVPESENRPVLDTGTYRQMLQEGVFERRPLFQQFTSNGVVWDDGQHEKVDTVIFATGYRPSLDYLAPLDILKPNGFPKQKRGVAKDVRGLYFVGIPGQRNGASATLRGSGPDAQYIVRHLSNHLKSPSKCVIKRPLRRLSGRNLSCC